MIKTPKKGVNRPFLVSEHQAFNATYNADDTKCKLYNPAFYRNKVFVFINESFVHTNESFVYINKGFVYKSIS